MLRVFLVWVESQEIQNHQNLGKTKKTKNQNFSENVWSEAHVCFFFVLPSFFVFLVLTLKKLKKIRFFLVFWINWWLKNCEKQKKLKVFFGFSLHSQKETKATNIQKPKKNLEFFWFFTIFKPPIYPKNQKTLFFLAFSRSKPKKNKKT